jgi:hypothetical protein
MIRKEKPWDRATRLGKMKELTPRKTYLPVTDQSDDLYNTPSELRNESENNFIQCSHCTYWMEEYQPKCGFCKQYRIRRYVWE